MSEGTTSNPPAKRNASDTRERILAAARSCFSRKSFDGIGVREIAGEAGVDAALVNRYFGGKEGLFAEAIRDAFHVDQHIPADLSTLGDFLVAQLMEDGADDDQQPGGFNPLRLLLLASTSAETSALVSAQFHEEFVAPLAKKLAGRDAALRAALIGSYVIGLATMRHLLASPTLSGAAGKKVARLTGAAIQACVSAPG
jgi:AcrR family transcriptional regulator